MTTVYTVNNKVLRKDGKWLIQDPYNPLGLPPLTVRVKYQSGYTPSVSGGTNTLVDSENNIYDITVNSDNWRQRFQSQARLLEVIGANIKDVTNISQCFSGCTRATSICSLDLTGLSNSSITRLFDNCSALTSIGNIKVKSNFITSTNQMFNNCKVLTSVPLFDTSAVTDMTGMFYTCKALTSIPQYDTSSLTTVTNTNGLGMFYGCTSLTTVPYINTSSVTSMIRMFYNCTSLKTVPLLDTSSASNVAAMFSGCTNVESGALALYQQMSSQATPPSTHTQAFTNCGSNTTTGAAELAQIPSDWK
jgi:surface protein